MPLKTLWRVVRVGYLVIYSAMLLALVPLLIVMLIRLVENLGRITSDDYLVVLLWAAAAAPAMISAAVQNRRVLMSRQTAGWRRAVGIGLLTLMVLTLVAFLICAISASWLWGVAYPQHRVFLVAVWAISLPLLATNLIRLIGIPSHKPRR